MNRRQLLQTAGLTVLGGLTISELTADLYGSTKTTSSKHIKYAESDKVHKFWTREVGTDDWNPTDEKYDGIYVGAFATIFRHGWLCRESIPASYGVDISDAFYQKYIRHRNNTLGHSIDQGRLGIDSHYKVRVKSDTDLGGIPHLTTWSVDNEGYWDGTNYAFANMEDLQKAPLPFSYLAGVPWYEGIRIFDCCASDDPCRWHYFNCGIRPVSS